MADKYSKIVYTYGHEIDPVWVHPTGSGIQCRILRNSDYIVDSKFIFIRRCWVYKIWNFQTRIDSIIIERHWFVPFIWPTWSTIPMSSCTIPDCIVPMHPTLPILRLVGTEKVRDDRMRLQVFDVWFHIPKMMFQYPKSVLSEMWVRFRSKPSKRPFSSQIVCSHCWVSTSKHAQFSGEHLIVSTPFGLSLSVSQTPIHYMTSDRQLIDRNVDEKRCETDELLSLLSTSGNPLAVTISQDISWVRQFDHFVTRWSLFGTGERISRTRSIDWTRVFEQMSVPKQTHY